MSSSNKKFEDRWYQTGAVEALTEAVKEPGCNPLVAAPTGSGKTIIISRFVENYLKENPDDMVLILSHVQNILEQDLLALQSYFPEKDIGLWSSGLESKTIEQITVAGIQSVYNAIPKFKWFNLVIIDEAHSVSHKSQGMYRKFLDDSLAIKIGLSATIFRTGHGYLHKGANALFTKVAYDLTSLENFDRLIKEGYLSPLLPITPEKLQLKSDHIKKSAGDYNIKALALEHDQDSITRIAVDQIIYYGKNYKKWLVFAIDIDHANHIHKQLIRKGIVAGVLHSRIKGDRSVVETNFRSGKMRALVSVGMVTTGFDVPDIDLIALLRPTMSPGLHVQMAGRGLRPAPGKKHCLVLDFAGNTARLGPINNVKIPVKGKSTGEGGPMTRNCPKCPAILPISAKECNVCGHVFPVRTKLTTTASMEELIQRQDEKKRWYKVKKVSYILHRSYKQGVPDSIKVTYWCGIKTIQEFWGVERSGYFGKKSRHVVKYRGYTGPMNNVSVLKSAYTLKQPTKIYVDSSGTYPNILQSSF